MGLWGRKANFTSLMHVLTNHTRVCKMTIVIQKLLPVWPRYKRGLFFPGNKIFMNNTMPITASGLEELKKEFTNLSEVKRPAIVTRLSAARSMGDLSENSDYINAKEELSFLDGSISELEDLLKNAKIVSPASSDKVDFGHSVTVQMDHNETTFHIVGEWEAKPAQQKISHSSPLGQALMGKKVGDKAEVDAPAGKIIYTILDIS
jgi:transcription elongation factor GreA